MNKIILAGYVGMEPKIHGSNGTTVATLSIATNDNYKSKDGQLVEQTDWHQLAFFGNMAKVVQKYITKGSRICVDGKLKHSQYEKDGEKRWSTQVVVNNMEMMGGKRKEDNRNAGMHPPPANPGQNQNSAQPDDDIPF